MRILLSACLAGLRTRYNGASAPYPVLDEIGSRAVIVTVCSEILGGLGIPRVPCYFQGGDGSAVLAGTTGVVNREKKDGTAAFLQGAEETLRIANRVRPDVVIFKARSSSYGIRRVDI